MEQLEKLTRRRPFAKCAQDESHDALALLRADHEEVRRLFAEALAESTSAGDRQKLFGTIADALTMHAKVEERVFYPAVKERSKARSHEREEVLEAIEEHGAVKDAIRKLKRASGRDESYRAKLQVLAEMVEHHAEEEEHTMFPEARRLLGEQRLLELGREIAALKEGARRTTRRAARSTPPRRKAAARSTRRTAAR